MPKYILIHNALPLLSTTGKPLLLTVCCCIHRPDTLAHTHPSYVVLLSGKGGCSPAGVCCRTWPIMNSTRSGFSHAHHPPPSHLTAYRHLAHRQLCKWIARVERTPPPFPRPSYAPPRPFKVNIQAPQLNRSGPPPPRKTHTCKCVLPHVAHDELHKVGLLHAHQP